MPRRDTGGAGTGLPAGTVTFLLTDVEGSTPLWEADTEGMARAMARHEAIVAAAIERHGGARPLEQGEGDNAVAAFTRASDAAAAALTAQLDLHAEPWPDGIELRVRMAVHTGEAHLQEGRTYAGPDLNRCARLRGLAHGGQILVSGTTHDLLVDRLPAGTALVDLGRHRLKGLDRPEHVHQLTHPDLPTTFPALMTGHEAPSNLPTAGSGLVGRDDDLAAVLDLLTTARFATLTGSGGCGKTRLALEVAHAARERFPDGTWWVDLAPIADPGMLALAVLQTIGGREEAGTDATDLVTRAMADQDLLLVLDNAEHLVDECAAFGAAMLERTTRPRLLVTSREPIGLDQEWAWRVPSLEVPSESAPFAEVAATAAVQLFAQRAARARPGFGLGEDNAGTVAQICRRLDGIPLAIELAAAMVRVMSPQRIAAGLDDRFRLLTGGGRRNVPRQQTLQSSVEWSHALLDHDEQVLFRRLTPFAGGFTLDAAEAVVGDDDLDAYGVLDLLARLVDKSLVVADPERHEPRYHLLETIRQYANDRLVEAGEVEVLRDRHLAWCVSLTANAAPELTGPTQSVWLAALEDELENLRAAVDWAVARDDGAALWSIAGNLPFFWVLHGHFADAVKVVAAARSLGARVPEADQLPGQWACAYAAVYAGDYEQAFLDATHLIERARALGNDALLARALDTLGTIEMFVDSDAGRVHLSEAATLARAQDDHWCLCDALQVLAYVAGFQDECRHMVELLDEARPLAVQLDNAQLLGWDHAGRMWVATRMGTAADARRQAELARGAVERSGDPAVSAMVTFLLAWLSIADGRAEEAIAPLAETLDTHLTTGAGQGVPGLLISLAFAHAAAGNPDWAIELIDTQTERLQMGGPFEQSQVPFARALALSAAGRRDEAMATAATVLADGVNIDNRWVEGQIRHLLGWCALADGEVRQAEQLAHAALELARRGPYPLDTADALRLLGLVAGTTGDPAAATRLLGAAQAIIDRYGVVDTMFSAILGRPDTDPLRRALGDEAFATAWAEGAELSLVDAVAYATRARGDRRRPAIGWDSLTPTELTVVSLVVEGLTNKAIAERMYISPGTVKTHLAHIFAKLGVTRRAELAAEAVRRGHEGTPDPR